MEYLSPFLSWIYLCLAVPSYSYFTVNNNYWSGYWIISINLKANLLPIYIDIPFSRIWLCFTLKNVPPFEPISIKQNSIILKWFTIIVDNFGMIGTNFSVVHESKCVLLGTTNGGTEDGYSLVFGGEITF